MAFLAEDGPLFYHLTLTRWWDLTSLSDLIAGWHLRPALMVRPEQLQTVIKLRLGTIGIEIGTDLFCS